MRSLPGYDHIELCLQSGSVGSVSVDLQVNADEALQCAEHLGGKIYGTNLLPAGFRGLPQRQLLNHEVSTM